MPVKEDYGNAVIAVYFHDKRHFTAFVQYLQDGAHQL